MSKLTRALNRIRGGQGHELGNLKKRVALLESGLEESRRLNERLSDVLDVVVELLIPATERNEERLAEALKKL